MSVTTFIREEIKSLENNGLKRRLRSVQSAQGPRIVIDGKEVLNFCSNNYLGLADDARLRKAAIDSIAEEGVGAGASRLICGNISAHNNLEKTIAKFKGTESCLVFNTGYMANVGIISSLVGRGDIVFSDKLNHASIIDGILLSQAEFKRYPHNDMATLEEMLKKDSEHKKRLIVTDSVFSMDGDIAPLDQIVKLAKKYNAMAMIDEAHAFGIMGKKGKGLAEHFGVEREIDIQMGTLSKAAGVFGAYCCGKKELIDYLINKSRSFIYTTALPPMVAAAATKAIEIIEETLQLRKKLWQNTEYVLKELKQAGFNTMNSQTPIIPILVKDSKLAVELSKALFEEGIFIVAIRPPTVPTNSARLRLSIMASHSDKELKYLVNTLKRIGKKLCLI